MTEESKEHVKKEVDPSLYALDFTTSSAISKIGLKFLILYVPIFWFGGICLICGVLGPLHYVPNIIILFILPIYLFAMYYVFFFGCVLYTKLFLILINLIHKPREGVFRAEEGDPDYEFWRLRTELKKLGVWLLNNCPLPWSDAWVFRWFGLKMNFSSHLHDAWCDIDFVDFGRKVLVGQGVVLMSSMVVGKYLIIKKIILDDYVVLGGHATVAPGTYVGKDTLMAAVSKTTYGQILEPGWIYFGVPARKLKRNKVSEGKRDIIIKRSVDEETKFEVKHDVNIDEELKDKINGGN